MKTFSISIVSLLLLSSTAYCQKGRWQIEDKRVILSAIWNKDLVFIPVGKLSPTKEVILMTIPDSILQTFDGHIDKIASMYICVYYFYVLSGHHINFDTIHVEIFSTKNMTKPIYMADLDVDSYKVRPSTPLWLAQSLMFLCPKAEYYIRSDDMFLEQYKIQDTITEKNYHTYDNFAGIMAGITGKHFFSTVKGIQRIVIIIKDNRGISYPFTFYIHTAKFLREFGYV